MKVIEGNNILYFNLKDVIALEINSSSYTKVYLSNGNILLISDKEAIKKIIKKLSY